MTLTSGDYNLKWEYSKDGSVTTGEDCAWVDYIILPASGDNVLTAAFVVDNNNPCENEAITFTSSSIGDITSWSWTFEGGDPATSDEENPTVSYAIPGDYSVTLEVGDGASTASITKEDYITVHNCTGVEEVNASVSLYPNPNNGIFYVDIKGMENANMTIINSLGSVVYSENNMTMNNSMKRIDLSNKAEGVYMLIIENDVERIIEKIILK